MGKGTRERARKGAREGKGMLEKMKDNERGSVWKKEDMFIRDGMHT